MKLYLWIAGLVLLAVAALAIWFNFSDPKFVAGLVSVVIAAIMPVILKRMAPETEARWRDAMKRGLGWDSIKKRPKDNK